MPTGYTAKVCDGEVTEFPDFALQCARAFGALIEMRDDPMDAPIPEAFKPSTYNADRLAEAKTRWHELQGMTSEQAEHAAFKDHQDRVTYAAQANERRDAENARLDAMTAKVSKWTPPTPDHCELKSFMLQQLSISKSDYRSEIPVRLTASEWLAQETSQAERDIKYHTEAQCKENERTAQRTEWVKALRLSLHTKAAE